MNDQTGISYKNSLLAGVTLEVDERFNYQFRFPNGAFMSASMTEVLLWEVVMQLCCSESGIALTADAPKEE